MSVEMSDNEHPVNGPHSRFVIHLHHVGPASRSDANHWDWMFESSDGLLTWATPPLDPIALAIESHAEQLPHHRANYLDYEGSISGNRGRVERVAWGTYRNLRRSADQFEADLCFDDDSRCVSIEPVRVSFYRSFRLDSSEESERCAVWRLRFLGRNDTN